MSRASSALDETGAVMTEGAFWTAAAAAAALTAVSDQAIAFHYAQIRWGGVRRRRLNGGSAQLYFRIVNWWGHEHHAIVLQLMPRT